MGNFTEMAKWVGSGLIRFATGGVGACRSLLSLASMLSILCMLATPVGAVTFVNSDPSSETISDSSGLTWKRCPEGQTYANGACSGAVTTFGWNEANNKSAAWVGQGWRVPTIEELKNTFGAPTSVFPRTTVQVFWSSEENLDRVEFAWYANTATQFSNFINKGSPFAVRLVRKSSSSGTTTTTSTSTTTGAVTTTTAAQGSTTTTSTSAQSTTTTSSTTTTTKIVVNLSSGWNLLGNSLSQSIDVKTTFTDANAYSTVWKWDVTKSVWQFFSPNLTAVQLADYVQKKGYGLLETINAGEGFWVNAKIAKSFDLSGLPYKIVSGSLVSGWNLVATSDDVSPAVLNRSIGDAPPSTSSSLQANFATLWAWDSSVSNWYFYAPSLDSGATLSDYIKEKGYIGFGNTKTLGNGVGFWVNKTDAPAAGSVSNQPILKISLWMPASNSAAEKETTELAYGFPIEARVALKNENGEIVPNAVVSFTSDQAVVTMVPASGKVLTNAEGVAKITLKVVGTNTSGSALLLASSTVGSKSVTDAKGFSVRPPGLDATISLGVNKATLRSDNSDAVTVTATVIDKNNAAIPDIPVTFSADGGVISSSTVTADKSGKATVMVTSGTLDFSNRVVTVSAIVDGAPTEKKASIPLAIFGASLTLASSDASVLVGKDVKFSAKATNAAGTEVNGQVVRLSIGANEAGALGVGKGRWIVNGNPVSGDFIDIKTGVTGEVTASLRADQGGDVHVVAEWLKANSVTSGVSARKTVKVNSLGISVAKPELPKNSLPTSLAVSTELPFEVTVPYQSGDVSKIRFVASAGVWKNAVGASLIVTPTFNAANASYDPVKATYIASANSGMVTVQVEALDSNGVVISQDSRSIVVSAPAKDAAKVTLQASVSTISPSSGVTRSTSILTASVRNANAAMVGAAPVLFELLNTTGTGESISNSVVLSDSNGQAIATFVAGTLPTNGPVTVQACILGADGTVDATKCDKVQLIVASSAVSVTIATGEPAGIVNGTIYELPGSLMVVDANGSPAVNQDVTLSLFPVSYARGEVDAGCEPTYYGVATQAEIDNAKLAKVKFTYTSDSQVIEVKDQYVSKTRVVTDNFGATLTIGDYNAAKVDAEDVNRNGILDLSEDVSLDGALTPSAAAGGAVQKSVRTDSSGIASFKLVYPKISALFVTSELTARISVSGTENLFKQTFLLPMSPTDSGFVSLCPIKGERNFGWARKLN